MTPLEIAIWSACAGVYLSYFCLSCFYAAFNRSAAGLQTAAFIGFCGFHVLMCSGLIVQFVPGLSKATFAQLQLASGPLSAAVAAYGLRLFLRAHQRDAIIDIGSMVICAWCALQLLALLWPDQRRALEIVGLNLVLASVGSFWLATRSWLLGDRYALAMAMGGAALVFAMMGLHAQALEMLRSDLWLQFFTAVCAALFVVISSHTLKRRYTEYLRMRRALTMNRDKDLLTQLWTGAALVRKVDDAVARARRNRKEMAVICVEITNTGKLNQEFGNHGLEQVIYTMAALVQKAAGATATVGRYSDTSFMVIYDSIKKPAVLRTVGLRLAGNVRRPIVLNPYSTSPREFRADIGVGVARISPGREARKRAQEQSTHMGGFDSLSLAQDVLHEATELALVARAYSSRSAILDAYSRKPIALEAAELD